MKEIYKGDAVNRDFISNRKKGERWLGWLSLCLMVLIGASGFAQVSEYTFAQSAGTYVPITGGTLVGQTTATTTLDSEVYSALPIGFSFTYNGLTYTTFGLNANGWISMGSAAPVSSSVPLSTGTINNVISAVAGDLFGRQFITASTTNASPVITMTAGSLLGVSVGDAATGTGIAANTTVVSISGSTVTLSANATSTGTSRNIRFHNGTIRYETIGTSPNRSLVVQFSKFSRWATSAPSDLMNFQIVLNETTNSINLVYDIPYVNVSATRQVGLRGSSSADFNNRSTTTDWSATIAGTTNASSCTLSGTVFPSSGRTFTWTPPPPVTTPPNCATGHSPADLATAVARNPTFSWTAPSAPAATSYDVYFGASTNPALLGNTAATAVTLTTLLEANTTYYWRVVPKNAIGDAVGCIERSFTTGTGLTYCPTSYTNGPGTTNSDAITNVTLGALNNTSTANNVTPFYAFFNTVTIPDIAQSTNANISITFGDDGSQFAGVWIDFNQNGTFEASEGVVSTVSAGSSGTTILTIAVPAGAVLGNTRMRVRGGNDSALTTAQACGASSSTWGETEDYIVNITAPPSCLAPTALLSSAITTTTATLSWTDSASSPVNGYDIYYSTVNTAPVLATTPTVNNHSASPLNITSLTSATTYFWWVRADCVGDTSAWASGGSFATLCTSSTIPTTLETLESVTTTLPVCWDRQLVSGTNNWFVATANGTGDITAAFSGTKFMVKDFQTSNAVLFSLPLDYSSVTLPTRINTYLHRHALANVNDEYKVFVNTSPSLAGATEILSLFSLTTIEPTVAATGWYNYNIDIPTSFNGEAAVYVIFQGITTAGFSSYALGIDDFKVEITPCPEWTGAVSTAWNLAGNWCDNTVPSALTNVIINSANPAIISTDVTVASITLGASANVTVNGTLNVGNISVASGGTMTVANDAAILQTAMATNTGMVKVERNSTPLFRQDYTLWSSPVSGQNLRAFSTQTLFNRFSSYDTALGTNGNYVQEIVTVADAASKTFTNAKGYLIRMPNNWDVWNGFNDRSSYLGSFTGTLNNGDVTIALSGANTRFNLVGNPYASPILISDFFADNQNLVQNTLYFWRKVGSANPANTASGFSTLSGMGFVSSDPTITQAPTNIETGQGFFVVAGSAAPGDLVFNNAMRNNGAATFFRGAADTTTEMHRMWLNLSNATNVVGQTLIGYSTGATQGVDSGIDALYFNDSDVALTSLIDNNEYIIQGRSVPFVNTDIVPLGFKTDVTGSFTISLSNFDGLFADNQDIFLKDNVTGIIHNLKVASYTFTTPVGVHNTRFEVQYTNAVLGINNPISGNNSILIGVKNQQININAGAVVMEKIELIDVAGRVIFTQDAVNATSTTLDNVVSANQMLIVRISTKENGVVTQKIIF